MKHEKTNIIVTKASGRNEPIFKYENSHFRKKSTLC